MRSAAVAVGIAQIDSCSGSTMMPLVSRKPLIRNGVPSAVAGICQYPMKCRVSGWRSTMSGGWVSDQPILRSSHLKVWPPETCSQRGGASESVPGGSSRFSPWARLTYVVGERRLRKTPAGPKRRYGSPS